MKSTSAKGSTASKTPLRTLEKGQIWKCANDQILVVRVGRYLVEHRTVKTPGARQVTPASYTSIANFQERLSALKAKLVES